MAALAATRDQAEPLRLADLKKAVMVPRAAFEHWLQLWDWTWHQLSRGEYPGGFTSLDEFQLACICADPVLWAASFLREPDAPEIPYRFWDYQEESIRHRGNTLHECGAEVGKTREIIGYLLWRAFTVSRGSAMVGAPMTIHLLEIIDAIEEQLDFNPDFKGSLKEHRKHPHHMLKFTNGFKVDFRPAGFDGTAFRGVHARTAVLMDEAPKAKNKDIFKEFWRAGKPGCEFKLYGTPDGDRSCEFFRLCQKAEGRIEEDSDESTKDLRFRKFKWGKPLMPAPFWSPERRRFYIDQYGGEDSPGYQQNVLGNWGDPENSVFPWHQFSRLLKEIPEYRVLKVLVDDSQGEVSVFAAEYRSVIRDWTMTKPEEVILADRRMAKHEFDLRAEIRSLFSHIPGLTAGGADLGFSQDPTEILVKLVFGRVHRTIARVQLKGVSYDQQAEALDALDDVFDAGKGEMGWGIDFGNAGTAVVHILQNQEKYAAKDYESRLTGYQFGGTYEAVDEDGEVILDKNTERPVKLTGKELSTDLLTGKMQRVQLEYPHDPDIMLYYPNHTYHQGSKHRIFKKVDDHLIDADRVLTLRLILPGEGQDDFFACGN